MLYLYIYGGLYADLDLLPIEDHRTTIFKEYQNVTIMFPHDQAHGINMEWAYSGQREQPFFYDCLKRARGTGFPPNASGPKFVRKCFTGFYHPVISGSHPTPGFYGPNKQFLILESHYITALPWNAKHDDSDNPYR
eukprot:UN03439